MPIITKKPQLELGAVISLAMSAIGITGDRRSAAAEPRALEQNGFDNPSVFITATSSQTQARPFGARTSGFSQNRFSRTRSRRSADQPASRRDPTLGAATVYEFR
jgi:hypothetical protein